MSRLTPGSTLQIGEVNFPGKKDSTAASTSAVLAPGMPSADPLLELAVCALEDEEHVVHIRPWVMPTSYQPWELCSSVS